MVTSTHLRTIATPSPTAPAPFRADQAAIVLAPHHARADRIFTYAIGVHLLIALALAGVYQTWLITAACSGAAVLFYAVGRWADPLGFSSRCAFGVAIQTFTALHIYQMHGLAEMHFFFFTGFVVMLAGYDWKAMWPGTVLIIFQHILFAYLTNSGVKVHFFTDPRVGGGKLFFHFGIAIVFVGICGAWAVMMRRQVLADAYQKLELVRTEVAVRTSEEKLRSLTDALPGAVFQCHARRDGKRVFTYFSRGVHQLLGVEGEDSVSLDESLFDKIHPDDRTRFRAGLTPEARPGSRWADEFRGAGKSGPGWYRGHAVSQPAPDGGTLWTGVLFDITEQKELTEARGRIETKMRETQRLESLGVMAGGIAHDFNNLLTVMLGNTALARGELPPGSPLDAYLRPVERSAAHAADLCQQMLAYAGKGRFVVAPLDLSAVVTATGELLTHLAGSRVELVLELEAEMPPVIGDQAQVRQVVVNLVQNAAEALGERGGKVIVRTGWEGRKTHVPKAWLEVADDGPGMPPEVVARVFDPFFSTKFVGRGLGLSVVHGIVRGHNAEITVDSRLGVGTRFRVTFPVDESAAVHRNATPTPPKVSAAARPVTPSHEWVLVVDDELALRTVVARMVQALGYRAVAAGDAHAALRAMQEAATPPALILLDLTMPDVDGHAAVGLFRAARPGVPVVLMSGYSEHVLSQEYQGDGFAGFIQKPFSAAVLKAKVAPIIAGSRETDALQATAGG